MVRMGFFTGKLYRPPTDPSNIKECCTILDYKEPITDDDPYVIAKRKKLRLKCEGCLGCPIARQAFQTRNPN